MRSVAKTLLALVAAVTLATLAACASGGRVSSDLVTLYDEVLPDGMLEIEIERSGAIREMEADIPVSGLPDAVRDAAITMLPGARITGAEHEFQAGRECWEVKLIHEGRAWEVIADASGEVQETEQELRRGEAPGAVMESAAKTMPRGMLRSVERITHRDDTVEYHVKYTQGGASYKLVLAPDGTLLRHVREARAEIEIPVAP
jgi:hypothetical protein